MFCTIKDFTVAKVQILTPTSEKKGNPTAGGRPQTQLGTRYGWPLAHKLLHPLTGFVFISVGCPYHTPSSPGKPNGGDGLVVDNPTPPTPVADNSIYSGGIIYVHDISVVS